MIHFSHLGFGFWFLLRAIVSVLPSVLLNRNTSTCKRQNRNVFCFTVAVVTLVYLQAALIAHQLIHSPLYVNHTFAGLAD